MGRVDAVLGGVAVVAETPLTGGLYNAARLLELADGRRLVLKCAPPPGTPGLAHERGLLGTERLFHALAADAGLTVPRVLHHDPDGDAGSREWLLLGYVEGRTWDSLRERLSAADRAGLRRTLGAWAAKVARATGERYGYPQPEAGLSAGDWPAAFAAMLGALLADADRYGVELPVPAEELRALPERFGAALAEVRRPALVHFDAWEGNLLLTPGADGGWELTGVIDGERAFFGDPLAELVGLDPLGAAERDEDFTAGYRSVDPAFAVDDAGRARLALYRIYLALVMRTEAAPRAYTGDFADWVRTWSAERIAEQLAVLDGLSPRGR
ncbi:phosphotransferase family protein [Kitasatospora cineracea]|uniref:Fructosamine-3-kinase n=1 Tax=Kitasatospora cineracea TaxID=88074 RepID=A0A8G1UMA9_9ACTN|nr:phosphotransferase [Kitasatospora cineracea]ROR44267.1 fructosamine-3-kinase [Kitasatospora cineracea]